MNSVYFDSIIIGFGKGGKTLAATLAKKGEKVALIEKSPLMYGGTCINIGCIPTKSLVYNAKAASKHSQESFEQKSEQYSKAIAEKEALTAMLREKNYSTLSENPNITVITGEAAFLSHKTIAIRTKEKIYDISGNKIFINTGAKTIIPTIEGAKTSKRVFTSTSIMQLKTLPKRLVIIGGGYIGLEFASMYASYGSEVTVIDTAEKFIPREDDDISEAVKDSLTKKNITFLSNASALSIEDRNTHTEILWENKENKQQQIIEADAVLLAIGRKPNTENLNLEKAGIQLTEQGAIKVDSQLKTTAKDIWAIGDVKGGLQFTYISLDDYRIIIDQLYGDNIRNTDDRNPVSYTVFINPPLSRIGLSEAEAREKGLDIAVAKLPVNRIPKALLINETEGFLKAIIDKNTKKILGCSLFCVDSSEIINTIALAMKTNQDYTVLKDFIFTHPSMSEALNDLFGMID